MRSTIARLGLGLAAAATAIVSVATAASAAPADPAPLVGPPCEVGNLCVWDGPGYTGNRVDYRVCDIYDVRAEPAALSRVASFVNNQTGDQVATFSGPGPDGAVVPQYSSTAVDARPDTTDRTTWVVQPC
ncbi:peptidase inhibitor family I36 protein [Pseudonocardia nantongensis]|uniref:peptidase inhibitor family I36 protein n=1 Tax=Pseudonocardia nantongensis TaxID=1181885 RepID=UPI00397A9A7C